MMRHYFSARTIPAHPRGVSPTAAMARLVASAGLSECPPARSHGASPGAVDLPSVAATADDRLAAATRTQEQAARSRLGLPFAADTS